MKDIDKAYHMVFRDMILRGPDFFRGVYDAKNGAAAFMYGIQTVMEHIAYRDGEDTYEKFSDMFTSNIVKSKEKAGVPLIVPEPNVMPLDQLLKCIECCLYGGCSACSVRQRGNCKRELLYHAEQYLKGHYIIHDFEDDSYDDKDAKEDARAVD